MNIYGESDDFGKFIAYLPYLSNEDTRSHLINDTRVRSCRELEQKKHFQGPSTARKTGLHSDGHL